MLITKHKFSEIVGRRIQQLRKVPVEDFANAMHQDIITVELWEAGLIDMDFYTACTIAEYLGVSVSELIEWEVVDE